jgi:hypothetical protein
MRVARRVWDRPRLVEALSTFAGNALFPRFSHRLRWRTRLGPRGTALYVLGWAAFGVAFVLAAWRLARLQEEDRADVRAHLGREPTTDEVVDYLLAHDE